MIYPYICKDCGKYFELSMTVSEYVSSDKICSYCASANVRRTYQTPTTIIYGDEGFTKMTKEEIKEEE